MEQKKIPRRQCIACRQMKEKKDLFRVVKAPEGDISADFTGKKNGRGAYICKTEVCLQKVCRAKLIHKIFKTNADAAIYEQIQKEFHERQSTD